MLERHTRAKEKSFCKAAALKLVFQAAQPCSRSMNISRPLTHGKRM
jgi:hypothetical protein